MSAHHLFNGLVYNIKGEREREGFISDIVHKQVYSDNTTE